MQLMIKPIALLRRAALEIVTSSPHNYHSAILSANNFWHITPHA